MTRSSNILKNLDWWIILIYTALVGFGWINIYAAVYNEEHKSILDITQQYGKQLLWISVAVILIIIILLLDSKVYEFLAYPIYAFSVLLLISVLLFGKEFNGARSWFVLGGFMFQPAEFAKVATSLALAKFMSEYGYKIERTTDVIKSGLIIILPMLMIVLQNDTGSALVYTTFVIVLFREGFSPVILLAGLLFAALFLSVLLLGIFTTIVVVSIILLATVIFSCRNKAIIIITAIYAFILAILLIMNNSVFHFSKINIVALTTFIYIVTLIYPAYIKKFKNYKLIALIFVGALTFTMSVEYIFNNILEKHQRTRINVVLGIESDPQGVGYNVNQSKIAIGSGGISGKGFLQGTQTKFDFVPEQETDFIFCTVGEEWGFIGTSSVIILFGILLVRIVILAERQRLKMYRIYGYSVAAILFFHVAINIGMTIGITPVIGIPLPFFSYGGSSLWSFTILLFIFIRLDATRMDTL